MQIGSFFSTQKTSQTIRFRWLYIAYYALLLISTVIGFAYGYIFSDIHFPSNRPEWVETFFNLLKLFWLVPFPYAITNFFSFARYPVFVRPCQPAARSMSQVLYFRYVTRGQNPRLVEDVVANSYRVLESSLPYVNWKIEIVSDNPLPIDTYDGQVEVIVVPESYHPTHGTKYKARALHYATMFSTARDQDWIIHLDEETRFDTDTVCRIQNFVIKEDLAVRHDMQSMPRIGQGVIIYGRGRIVNWLTTLADSIRVGDDYGRFRLQYEMGRANMGIHGSFIVINSGLESTIGFDHGAPASITEDAYFALVAQSQGVRFGFINAFMYEKSPFTVRDFIKQRHRWFGGLWICALSREIPFSQRYILITFMAMWSISWLCIAMVFVNLVIPTGTPAWLAIIGGVSFLYYVTLYVIGFVRTFSLSDGRRRFIGLLILQVLLIPVFSIMESAGVLYGLIKPPTGFYIVQKETEAVFATT